MSAPGYDEALAMSILCKMANQGPNWWATGMYGNGSGPYFSVEAIHVDVTVEERELLDRLGAGDHPVDIFARPIGTGMRSTGEGQPGVDMSDPDDHGIVRRLP